MSGKNLLFLLLKKEKKHKNITLISSFNKENNKTAVHVEKKKNSERKLPYCGVPVKLFRSVCVCVCVCAFVRLNVCMFVSKQKG